MYPSEPLDRATVGPLYLDFCNTPITNGDQADADLVAYGSNPAFQMTSPSPHGRLLRECSLDIAKRLRLDAGG